jgi:hypothetical protein
VLAYERNEVGPAYPEGNFGVDTFPAATQHSDTGVWRRLKGSSANRCWL